MSLMAGSAWGGRMNQYVSFASQQPIAASIMAASSSANTWVASRSRSPLASIQPVAMVFQKPEMLLVPAPFAQNKAMATCSAVRVSEMFRTSASPARYVGDPNAGGGADRNRAGPRQIKAVGHRPRDRLRAHLPAHSLPPREVGTRLSRSRVRLLSDLVLEELRVGRIE